MRRAEADEIIEFRDRDQLWAWLASNHEQHRGAWVRIQKARSPHPSITLHDLLEAGLAFGWSESARLAHDSTSYLQRFTPRRKPGTVSARNRMIAEKLERAGLMTPAGRRALGV